MKVSPSFVSMLAAFGAAVACCTLPHTGCAQTATLTTIYRFDGTEGAYPYAGLTLGADGNFYGSTNGTTEDSPTGAGTIFKITPDGALMTLHVAPLPPSGYFSNDGGAQYRSELTRGSDGAFYGVAFSGGLNGVGTLFKITSAGTYTTLHDFARADDGATPLGALLQASDGNFYGTTSNGGGSGIGGHRLQADPGRDLDDAPPFRPQPEPQRLSLRQVDPRPRRQPLRHDGQ